MKLISHAFVLLLSASMGTAQQVGPSKATVTVIDSSSSLGQRSLKKGKEDKKGKKGKKGKKEKVPKSTKTKSTKTPKSTGYTGPALAPGCDQEFSPLSATAQDVEHFRECLGYDKEAKQVCDSGESFSQSCDYTYTMGPPSYKCVCKEKSNAALFSEIDVDENGVGTEEEILNYLNQSECVFPFTYKNYDGTETTYNDCTTVDNEGYSWCSIKTNDNGDHIPSFYKYCTPDGTAQYKDYILSTFDKDMDGAVSLVELLNVVESDTFGRKLATSAADCGNDCGDLPSTCIGALGTLMPQCRNRYKTIPLDDEELLRILADAQVQSYEASSDESDQDYLSQPLLRYEMEGSAEWLSRDQMRDYSNDLGSPFFYLPCLLISEIMEPQELVAFLYRTQNIIAFGAAALSAVLCSAQMWLYEANFDAVTDGVDVVQWSLYNIESGAHSGKKILSFMGTDSSNAEQIVADVWGMGFSKPMMYSMVEEATEIARRLNPDYITGHSLGGFLAQGVCTETGIEGASFGGIGGHDPGSATTTIFQNVEHHGVKFEVVMNTGDIIARTVASAEGSECSYITSSCNVRWLDWGGDPLSRHSSKIYATEANQDYTRGWDTAVVAATTNSVQLPGVALNKRCDTCDSSLIFGFSSNYDAYCESNKCSYLGVCVEDAAPTYCPSDSVAGEETKSPCVLPEHCAGICGDNGQCNDA